MVSSYSPEEGGRGGCLACRGADVVPGELVRHDHGDELNSRCARSHPEGSGTSTVHSRSQSPCTKKSTMARSWWPPMY